VQYQIRMLNETGVLMHSYRNKVRVWPTVATFCKPAKPHNCHTGFLIGLLFSPEERGRYVAPKRRSTFTGHITRRYKPDDMTLQICHYVLGSHRTSDAVRHGIEICSHHISVL
jgi:hypothetical protein